ncbi:MAG: spore germination protein [Planifilum sp.]
MFGFKGFRRRRQRKNPGRDPIIPSTGEDLQVDLYFELEKNHRVIKDLFDRCYDITFRPFRIGKQIEAEIVFIESLADFDELNDHALAPLMKASLIQPEEIEQYLREELPVVSAKPIRTFDECARQVAAGEPVLFIDGWNRALNLGLVKREKRAVNDPESEPVIRGPKEGFIESLETNTALLRRRIQSPQLKMEEIRLGRYTQTRVIVAYMEGIVDEDVRDEVKRRLKRIDIDGVLDSGYIEELIEDNPFSPFPQIHFTERVDTVCASLLSGKVAILTDGTPDVMTVPVSLATFLQAAEDYYMRSIYSTAVRWLRYLLFFLSIAAPSFYVATISFHPEAVPTEQLFTFAAAREQIPLPTIVEMMLMEIAFEAVREAGLRLPKIIGSAVTIVGALIVGEAAVTAGIVSAPVVIIVAITGISSFTVPRYVLGFSMRILRFPLLIISGTLGMVGFSLAMIAIVIHLASLRSFGKPYLEPIGPLRPQGLKDVLIRAPWWKMDTRPAESSNAIRQAPDQKPGPERGGEG